MKKTLLILLVGLISFTGCKKDKDDLPKLTFTVSNLSSLIGKSPDHIKKVSPGTLDTENSDSDFLLFDYNEIPAIGEIALGYLFTDNVCDFLAAFSSLPTFDALDYMINLAEDEYGTGAIYHLAYNDAELIEEYFESAGEFWQFIEDSSLVESDIDDISIYYETDNRLVMVGGNNDYGYFMPSLDIAGYTNKSTAVSKDKAKLWKEYQQLILRKKSLI